MNESPFVRVYEDEEHRETSDVFWVNLNHVDSIEISKGGLIFLDIQQHQGRNGGGTNGLGFDTRQAAIYAWNRRAKT